MFALFTITTLLLLFGLADADIPGNPTNPGVNPSFATNCSGKGYPDAIYDPKGSNYWVYFICVNSTQGSSHVDAYSSPDLKEWKVQPPVLDLSQWSSMKAPYITSIAALAHEDKYYLYFSVITDFPNYDHFNGTGASSFIYVARSDNPGGPFTNPRPKRDALFNYMNIGEQFNASDNPTVFFDESNKPHLFFMHNDTVKGFNLGDDLISMPQGEGTPDLIHSNFTTSSGSMKVFMRKAKDPNGVERPYCHMFWKDSDQAGGYGTGDGMAIRHAMAPKYNNVYIEYPKVLQPGSVGATKLGDATVINVLNSDTWYLICSRQIDLGKTTRSELALVPLSFRDDAKQISDDVIDSHESTQHSIDPSQMVLTDGFDQGEAGGLFGWGEKPNLREAFSFNFWYLAGDVFLHDWTDPWHHEHNDQVLSSHSGHAERSHARALIYSNFTNFTYDIYLGILDHQDRGDVGVVFRVQDDSTLSDPAMGPGGEDDYAGYYTGIRADGSVVFGVANGAWTQLQENFVGLDTKKLHHMRVEASGPRFIVRVDDMDRNVIMLSDETFANGACGVRSFQADGAWDNLTISGRE